MKKIVAWAIVGLSASVPMYLAYCLMREARDMVGSSAALVNLTAFIMLVAGGILSWAVWETVE